MITGANSGLGLEFTRQYAAKGWTIIATHRRCDMPRRWPKSSPSTRRCASRRSTSPTSTGEGARSEARERARRRLDQQRRRLQRPQHVAPPATSLPRATGRHRASARWTRAARHDHGREHQGAVDRVPGVYPNVKAGTHKKIVAISSSNGTITGELPNPWPGAMFYRMSKAALNREMQIVAASVKGDGVTVVILNPGPRSRSIRSTLRGNPIMLKMSFTVENMIRHDRQDHDRRDRAILALRRSAGEMVTMASKPRFRSSARRRGTRERARRLLSRSARARNRTVRPPRI